MKIISGGSSLNDKPFNLLFFSSLNESGNDFYYVPVNGAMFKRIKFISKVLFFEASNGTTSASKIRYHHAWIFKLTLINKFVLKLF